MDSPKAMPKISRIIEMSVGGGREDERSGQVPVLEDPHERGEHRGQRQRVQGQGLDRQHDAAGEQEQPYEGEGDRPHRPRQAAALDDALRLYRGLL
jgi:hypothetical protein